MNTKKSKLVKAKESIFLLNLQVKKNTGQGSRGASPGSSGYVVRIGIVKMGDLYEPFNSVNTTELTSKSIYSIIDSITFTQYGREIET